VGPVADRGADLLARPARVAVLAGEASEASRAQPAAAAKPPP
jgi:hypothetical protein